MDALITQAHQAKLHAAVTRALYHEAHGREGIEEGDSPAELRHDLPNDAEMANMEYGYRIGDAAARDAACGS